MEDLINELIELVKATAPEVWRIAVEKVYADVTGDLFLVAAFLGLAIVFFALAKSMMKRDDYVDEEHYGLILTVRFFGLLFLVGVMATLSTVLKQLIATDYYAVQVLMDLVTNR